MKSTEQSLQYCDENAIFAQDLRSERGVIMPQAGTSSTTARLISLARNGVTMLSVVMAIQFYPEQGALREKQK